MAKAPRPGRVKTRLSPPLTPDQAAELNIAMLRDTAECLAEVARLPGAVAVVSYTPIGEEALFEGVLPESFLLIPQRGDTFGERLLATAEDLSACGFSGVCLIDSDSPTVPPAAYRTALQALSSPGRRVVLGPTIDGGYYLIGSNHPDPRLFEGIAWSTGDVYSQTASRAREAGYDLVELPLWYDVDDNATLSVLCAELTTATAPEFAVAPGYAAPHTRALLGRMDGLAPSSIPADAETEDSSAVPAEVAHRPRVRPVSPAGDDL